MKIIFYCQYVWGMGHFFRSLELVRALARAGHHVTLIAGGQKVQAELPARVRLVRLPTLYMDEAFTHLIAGEPGRSVDEIRRARREILAGLFQDLQPDLFVVELFPFGRRIFRFELEPLLDAIRRHRYGRIKTVCSLRDILVEKNDPPTYEQRVVDNLNRRFDLLLVHSDRRLLPLDETFSRLDAIRIPVVYTGFVGPAPSPGAGPKIRQALNLPAGQKLIVASAGGGRAGYPLLDGVLKACRRLDRHLDFRLEVFAGPFMETAEFEKLDAQSGPGLRVRRFTLHFVDYLAAADLSISLAGYNTCMNLLAARVPALVHPYSRQREQPLRVQKIKNLIPMKILRAGDLKPEIMQRHILQMGDRQRPGQAPALDMNGAENTARILSQLAGGKG